MTKGVWNAVQDPTFENFSCLFGSSTRQDFGNISSYVSITTRDLFSSNYTDT